MKKRFLTVILASVCVLTCFTGCGLGSYIENGTNKTPSASNPSNPGTPSNPVNPDNPDTPTNPDNPSGPTVSNNDYTVSVYYNNKLFDSGKDEVTVVWINDYDVKRVALGSDGRASAGELNGTYHVYLEGLSSKYAYNPNDYEASENDRKVSILLTDVRDPESGDGGGKYRAEGCYQIKYDGIYRAKINNSGKELYYEYQPTAAGWYSLESLVNVYANEVNPVLNLYGGTHAFKWFIESRNDGGATGNFTRNFRYDYYIDSSEVSHAFTFSISADHMYNAYPVYVDFEIKYRGEYVNEYSDVRDIRAKEAKIKAEERQPGQVYKYADMGTKIYSTDNFKFNQTTHYYHRYDEVKYADDPYGFGAGYGPVLCCQLNASIPSYTICKLYNADKQGLDGGSNYLKLGHVWIEEENKYATFDYTKFIKQDYYKVCNSEGVCYVTDELRQFLQKYAENQGLWTDGVHPEAGMPEQLGYYAKQDALWLFACGFYE